MRFKEFLVESRDSNSFYKLDKIINSKEVKSAWSEFTDGDRKLEAALKPAKDLVDKWLYSNASATSRIDMFYGARGVIDKLVSGEESATGSRKMPGQYTGRLANYIKTALEQFKKDEYQDKLRFLPAGVNKADISKQLAYYISSSNGKATLDSIKKIVSVTKALHSADDIAPEKSGGKLSVVHGDKASNIANGAHPLNKKFASEFGSKNAAAALLASAIIRRMKK